jgi:hypothetical protein
MCCNVKCHITGQTRIKTDTKLGSPVPHFWRYRRPVASIVLAFHATATARSWRARSLDPFLLYFPISWITAKLGDGWSTCCGAMVGRCFPPVPCTTPGERRLLPLGRLQEPSICWGVSASPWPGRPADDSDRAHHGLEWEAANWKKSSNRSKPMNLQGGNIFARYG